MPKYARKRDQSEAAIVAALEARGCLVVRGQDCDLYVKVNQLRATFQNARYLIECKTPGPNEKRRQKIQQQLKEVFGAQYCVCKTPQEALQALGLS